MSNHPVVQQALAQLDSADLAQRSAALQRLIAQKDDAIAPKVIPLLHDEHVDIRRLAVSVLSSNGGGETVQALIDSLFDAQADVRAAAATALGPLGDRSAVPPLIQALFDEHITVRSAAAEALGLLGDPRAVIDLIHMLDNDDASLEMTAAQALQRIGTPEALAAIQHLHDGEHYSFEIPEPPVTSDDTVRHIPPEQLRETEQEQAGEEVLRAAPDETPAAEVAVATPVQFSAYAPREIVPNVWQLMRAYVFKADADAAVAADAAQQLGGLLSSYREVERPAQTSIAEGALITATPSLDGFQFNPPSAQAAFYDDFERFDFKLRAVTAPLDQAANGMITFTVEGVIVADIPLSIYVAGSIPASDTTPAPVTRPLYQSIFCSYSHQDTQIIEHVERAYKALGLTFLRDVETLKSGQDWDAQLLQLIDQADIFQLFWSNAAAASQAVRKEWLHALSLKRQDQAFIRPVFWQQPMPPPAPELAAIHFAYEPDLAD